METVREFEREEDETMKAILAVAAIGAAFLHSMTAASALRVTPLTADEATLVRGAQQTCGVRGMCDENTECVTSCASCNASFTRPYTNLSGNRETTQEPCGMNTTCTYNDIAVSTDCSGDPIETSASPIVSD